MTMCFAAGCRHNSYRERCSFFRFPKENSILNSWMKMCGRADKNPNRHSRLCSCHFIDGLKENGPTVFSVNQGKYLNFKRPVKSKGKRSHSHTINTHSTNNLEEPKENVIILVKNETNAELIVPERDSEGREENDIILVKNETGAEVIVPERDSEGREGNVIILVKNETGAEVIVPERHSQGRLENDIILVKKETGAEVIVPERNSEGHNLRAKIKMSERDSEIHYLSAKIKILKSENECLKSKVDLLNLTTKCQEPEQSRMTYAAVKNDAKFLMYYTGLPNASVFESLLGCCTAQKFSYYDGWQVVIINESDQLLLTLMKLRLNLDFTDLSFRFKLSRKSVNNVFLTWLHLIHEVLFQMTMNKLPSTSKNQQVMPNSFSHLSNCRVIVGCTEIQCSVPRSSMNAQSQAYSISKSRNTFKGLVGVTPTGVITFVSDLYPGSCSDKELFIQSGIAEQLEPGDLVLADKGVLIQDCVPPGVSVNIPPFLLPGQFTKEKVNVTRNIVRNRIHVKRAIGRMKNFNILLCFPTNLCMYATTIFQVCACLVNLRNPIIKLEEPHST